jgi:hypothetical protein
MDAVQNQIFQASWPQGHEPVWPPNTETVASLALVIFAAYYSTALAIGTGIAIAFFWTVRKVSTWIVHQSAGPFANPEQVQAAKKNRAPLREIYQSVKMKTPDGLTLDGIFHQGSHTHKKAIIYCQGSGQFYENCADYLVSISDACIENISVLCFNPRGVGESEGSTSPEMLPYDAYTAFEYLVSIGYEPQDICIMGYSLGGAAGTIGASLAQKKYKHVEIGAVNLNSFAYFPWEVQYLFGDGVLAKICAILVRIFGWHLDVMSAWMTLRNANKTVVCHQQDYVIPFEASLYQALPHSDNNVLNGEPHGQREVYFHAPNFFDAVSGIKRILGLDHSIS